MDIVVTVGIMVVIDVIVGLSDAVSVVAFNLKSVNCSNEILAP